MKNLLTICLVLVTSTSIQAANRYWDLNGATAGAGGPVATGTWDATTSNWTTDSTGSSATSAWVAGDTAIFAAGSDATGAYSVTISSTGSPHNVNGGLTIEEGAVTLVQTSSSAIAIGAGTVRINDGATLAINAISTITHTAGGGGVVLDGTLRSLNTGVGGSFYTSNANITIGSSNTGSVEIPAAAADVRYSGRILDNGSGSTTLTKTGPGMFVTQVNTNTFTKLVVEGGLYRPGGSAPSGTETGVFGATPGAFLSDAITLTNGGAIGAVNTTTVNPNRGIVLGTGGGKLSVDTAALTVPGVISGSGNLTIGRWGSAGTQTVTLSGANTYTGTTFVQFGKLSVGNADALGSTSAGTQVDSGAEVLFTGQTQTNAEPFQIAGLGGSDNGAIAVISTSNVTLTGPVTLAADSQITVSSTSTLALTNSSSVTGTDKNLTIRGGGGAGGGGTISGAISLGTGGITKLEGGTWTLSNVSGNSYSGNTAINGGTLAVTNTSGSGTGSGNITIGTGTTAATLNVGTGGAGGSVSGNITFANTSNTSTVNFNRSTDSTYAGTISGSNGNVTKSGAGVLTLSNANTYTGSTTINGGTLNVANVSGSATGTGAVVVNSGGTLAGVGAVAGPVTVNSGGTVAPGNSPGVLNVGAITFNAGSIFQYEVDSNAAPAVSADLINANGNLTIAAAGALLNVSYAGTNLLSKLTLVSYAGTWDGNMFDGFTDDSVVTLGGNQYVINYNDVTGGVNFGGGIYGDGVNPHFLTLTAVPEAGAFISGCVVCCVVGLGVLRRKLVRKKPLGAVIDAASL